MESTPSVPALTRRQALGAAGAGAGALVFGFDAANAARRRPRGFIRGGGFPHGVSAGVPGQRSISVWTRVDGIERTGRLHLEIATDPDFRRVVERRVVKSHRVRDFAVRERIFSRRLKPCEEYFYRFATRTESSSVGRFRTLRPPDSREAVKIAVFSCQDFQAGYYTAHRGLAEEHDVDLVVCLGDYVYEKNFYDGPRRDTLGANGDGEVQTLDEYRAKYRLYKSDPDLRAMHESAAYVVVWDDHEVEDNYADELPGEATDDVRVPFAQRRVNGYNAFFEFHAIPRYREDPNRIFRRIPLGGQADLFVTDNRAYRDDQPCGDQQVVPCPEGAEPGRTLLGAAQRAWLRRGLQESRANWKLIGSPVQWTSFDFPLGNAANPDGYDGYAAERNDTTRMIREQGIRDVSVLVGDVHFFAASQLTTTGRTGGTPVGTELVCGSITSQPYTDSLGFPDPADPVGNEIRTQNPHIRYIDIVRRGYGLVTVRSDELVCDFRSPRSIATPTSTMETIASFRVPRGATDVERLQ